MPVVLLFLVLLVLLLGEPRDADQLVEDLLLVRAGEAPLVVDLVEDFADESGFLLGRGFGQRLRVVGLLEGLLGDEVGVGGEGLLVGEGSFLELDLVDLAVVLVVEDVLLVLLAILEQVVLLRDRGVLGLHDHLN